MANKQVEFPHNTEAEKAVLGAMLRSTSVFFDTIAALDTEDFYEENENHRAIFDAMKRLYKRGITADVQTITDELINAKQIDVSGGPEYLVELADSVITFAHINNYVRIVKDQANLRAFIKEIQKLNNECFNKDIGNIDDFLKNAQNSITTITEKRRVGDFQTSSEVTKVLAEELKKLKPATSDDSVTENGIPTGYPEMNKKTHGFQRGEFIVIAARPGVGKTALSLNLAFNAARHGHTVAYFSLEMPATMLFKRLISADSNVKFDSLVSGWGLNQNVQLKIQQSCAALAKMNIYVDDTAGINILDIAAKSRKLKEKDGNLGLIIVDYIGLVTTSIKSGADSRQLQVQYVSQTLKKLALDLKVPVIGVAQLNRNVELRNNGNGEPMLSDLRESGSLEQDADIVMMLHETKIEEGGDTKGKTIFEKQDEAVNASQQKIAQQEGGQDTKLVNVIIAKNRSGQTGKVPLLFRRNYCKFDAFSKEGNEQILALDNERVSYFNRD